MPIDAVKIPQNVYVEDKIIGPVSLRQLTITGIGAGIGYVLYSSALKSGVTNIVFLAFCWFPAVIAAAFSFLKINDLSLITIIFLWIEGMHKPKERYWTMHQGLSINLITGQAVKEMADANSKIVHNASRLADITQELEKREKAMSHLAAHNNPTPDDLEPITTQLKETQTRENVDAIHVKNADPDDQQAVRAVDPSRVEAGGLDPQRSIDTLVGDSSIYERLIARQA